MKFLTKWDTEAAYNAAKDNLATPQVAVVTETNTVNYKKYVPHDYSKDYLTFRATESGEFKLSGSTTDNILYYSLDDGKTWTSLAKNVYSPTVATGDKILWKATLSPVLYEGVGIFTSTGNFIVEGNAMSLLYGDDFVGQTSFSGKKYAFYSLFNSCTKLTSAENLVLPATTLEEFCYGYMFSACTSITTAPELPATTMVTYCYHSMFRSCTSLIKTPELPATTLAPDCYSYMFEDCTSLSVIPSILPATTLANNCYRRLFKGCTSITTVPELPATTLASTCYECMFSGCTSITVVPSDYLPATTVEQYCYSYMFSHCTNLTTAPELPATTLKMFSYQSMFYGCNKINYIKCLATNISPFRATAGWVNGVSSEGTFVKSADMSNWTTGVDGIPANWTVVDES